MILGICGHSEDCRMVERAAVQTGTQVQTSPTEALPHLQAKKWKQHVLPGRSCLSNKQHGVPY